MESWGQWSSLGSLPPLTWGHFRWGCGEGNENGHQIGLIIIPSMKVTGIMIGRDFLRLSHTGNGNGDCQGHSHTIVSHSPPRQHTGPHSTITTATLLNIG